MAHRGRQRRAFRPGRRAARSPTRSSLAQGRRTVIILPATEATLAAPELPVRGGARIAQAVPFALEEQLASDLEYRAFRRRHAQRDDRERGTPVVMVVAPVLERWQATWEAAGIHPDAAYSESSLIPAAPNATRAACSMTPRCTCSDRTPSLMRSMREPLAVALDLALGDARRIRASTSRSTRRQRTTNAQRDFIEGLRERTATLQVKLLPDGTLPLLAAQIPDGAPSQYPAGRVRAAVLVRHAVQAVARAGGPCRRNAASHSSPRRA